MGGTNIIDWGVEKNIWGVYAGRSCKFLGGGGSAVVFPNVE